MIDDPDDQDLAYETRVVPQVRGDEDPALGVDRHLVDGRGPLAHLVARPGVDGGLLPEFDLGLEGLRRPDRDTVLEMWGQEAVVAETVANACGEDQPTLRVERVLVPSKEAALGAQRGCPSF